MHKYLTYVCVFARRECSVSGSVNLCCDVFVELNAGGCESVNISAVASLQRTMQAKGLCSTNSSCYSLCPDGQYYQSGACKP